MSTKKINTEDVAINEEVKTEEAAPVVEEAPKKTTKKKSVELKVGVVTECALLKVRKTPFVVDDNIEREIPIATELKVDVNKSTDEFYKVNLADGTEGYCMKKFINIGE